MTYTLDEHDDLSEIETRIAEIRRKTNERIEQECREILLSLGHSDILGEMIGDILGEGC